MKLARKFELCFGIVAALVGLYMFADSVWVAVTEANKPHGWTNIIAFGVLGFGLLVWGVIIYCRGKSVA